MRSFGPQKDETSPGIPPADSIPKVGLWDVAFWLIRKRRRFKVSGRSMLPLLAPGDEVLVRSQRQYDVGDIVVARHPFRIDVHLVKQVGALEPDGRAYLVGLNRQESSDSEVLGSVPLDLFLGRVVARF